MAYFRVGGGGSSVGGPLINTTLHWYSHYNDDNPHSTTYNFSEPVPIVVIKCISSSIGLIEYSVNGANYTIGSGQERTFNNVTTFTINDGQHPEGSAQGPAEVQVIVNS